jgi:exopolysaccharide biosynthesis polyprenyl glycosylphosphotransferase
MKNDFFSGKKQLFFLFLYISDLLSFVLSSAISAYTVGLDMTDIFYIRFFIFSLLILIITYSGYELYKDKRNMFDDTDFMKILYSSMISFMILGAFILMFDPMEIIVLFQVIVIALLTNVLFTTLGRMVLGRFILAYRKKGYDNRNVIYFGEKDEDLIEKIGEKQLGYKIILATKDFRELKKQLKRAQVVFMKMESLNDDVLELMIRNDKISWKIVSSVLNLVIDPVAFDEFRDYPIINISNKDNTSGYLVMKRAMDIIFSGLTIAILSPFLLLIAILIKWQMPGPVFFKQERLGRNMKKFMCYKFRTMVVNAEAMKDKLEKNNEVKGLFKMKDDPRITPLGKIMRRACLDELPQLFNIFNGDMSIVGPRPHLERELPNFSGWRMARFKVKPGLTGLWQVNGRHELNFDKAVLYDIYYVKHMSPFLDISIILKTIPAIVINKGRF